VRVWGVVFFCCCLFSFCFVSFCCCVPVCMHAIGMEGGVVVVVFSRECSSVDAVFAVACVPACSQARPTTAVTTTPTFLSPSAFGATTWLKTTTSLVRALHSVSLCRTPSTCYATRHRMDHLTLCVRRISSPLFVFTDYGRFFLNWYSSQLIQHAERVLPLAQAVFEPLGVALAGKVAGIHWWYLSAEHAAECTAGYYNTNNNNAYLEIANAFKKYNADFDFTCVVCWRVHRTAWSNVQRVMPVW